MIRSRIEATVRRAPQVMVKVTGGGRGMRAIAAHFRYITKNGRLEIEDDRGVIERGKDVVKDIEGQWRFDGAFIGDEGHRREAFNIMLSMPRGTDPQIVLRAAREFAKIEFADHRYVMVLHDHQANPHVHLSVKTRSKHGQRLNPRKADLHRWRERFAERLHEWGVDAEASRQVTRGEDRKQLDLWRIKAGRDGRLQSINARAKASSVTRPGRAEALKTWTRIANVLATSASTQDKLLARQVAEFVKDMPILRTFGERAPEHPKGRGGPAVTPMPQGVRGVAVQARQGPERER